MSLGRMSRLVDLPVDALVRELTNENGPGSQAAIPQPVKDQHGDSSTSPPSRRPESMLDLR
jgi:hypothetical protein